MKRARWWGCSRTGSRVQKPVIRLPFTRGWQYATPLKFQSVARLVYRHVAAVTWPAIILIAAAHFLSSWAIIAFSEGEVISSPAVFWYYYLVTATTVGYGDYAPTTEVGRAIAVFWIMPGGIAIFTSIVAKVVQSAAIYWRRTMAGQGDYSDFVGHTVILGWHGENTRKMVGYMHGDRRDREIVLAAHRVRENPLPDLVHFVHGETLTAAALLTRAGVANAGNTVVTGHDDNETLAACLAVAAHSPHTHLVAFFNEESIADLLKAHCPEAECLVPMTMEMLARTADDPGSSRVPKILLSTLVGPTLFSMEVPAEMSPIRYADILQGVYQHHRATVLGVATGKGVDEIHLSPPAERMVQGGDILYYIADRRLASSSVAWSSFGQENN